MNPEQDNIKTKNVLNSFKHAFHGISSAFRTERNFRIHVSVSIVVLSAAFFLRLSKIEWAILILMIVLVIIFELINTAIEFTVDLAHPKPDEHARMAKDIAAAAVLICTGASIIIGLLIFIPKIFQLL